eukprot:gene9865-20524_t
MEKSLVEKLQSIEMGSEKYLSLSITSQPSDQSETEDSEIIIDQSMDLNRTADFEEPFEIEIETTMSEIVSAEGDSHNVSAMSFTQEYAPITRRQEIALEREARLKAEQDNLRFHPKLIARRGSNIIDSIPTDIRASRFEILYNEARQRQVNSKTRASIERPTFTPAISQKAKSRERSESPDDRSSRLYSATGAGRRNPDADKEIYSPASFKPKISKRAKSLERFDNVPLNERLHSRAQVIQEKHLQLKAVLEKQQVDECTFTPKINSRKSPLRQQEYRSSLEISDRMQRYLEERERKLEDAHRAKEEQELVHATFHPQLIAKQKFSNKEVDLVDVFTRLSTNTEKDSSVTSSTGGSEQEFSFKPTIKSRRSVTPNSMSPKEYVSVYDRLYEQGEQRKRELEIERQLRKQEEEKELNFNPRMHSHTNQNASHLHSPSYTHSSYKSSSSSLDGDKDQRVQVVERLTAGRHYVQEILTQLKSEYELRDCTFKPEISPASAVKAGQRCIKPVHERLSDDADKFKEMAKKRQEHYKAKELEECTFTPLIPTSDYLAPNRSSKDVFERLTPKKSPTATATAPSATTNATPNGQAHKKFFNNNTNYTTSSNHNDVFERLSQTPKSHTLNNSSGTSTLNTSGTSTSTTGTTGVKKSSKPNVDNHTQPSEKSSTASSTSIDKHANSILQRMDVALKKNSQNAVAVAVTTSSSSITVIPRVDVVPAPKRRPSLTDSTDKTMVPKTTSTSGGDVVVVSTATATATKRPSSSSSSSSRTAPQPHKSAVSSSASTPSDTVPTTNTITSTRSTSATRSHRQSTGKNSSVSSGKSKDTTSSSSSSKRGTVSAPLFLPLPTASTPLLTLQSKGKGSSIATTTKSTAAVLKMQQEQQSDLVEDVNDANLQETRTEENKFETEHVSTSTPESVEEKEEKIEFTIPHQLDDYDDDSKSVAVMNEISMDLKSSLPSSTTTVTTTTTIIGSLESNRDTTDAQLEEDDDGDHENDDPDNEEDEDDATSDVDDDNMVLDLGTNMMSPSSVQ